MPTVLHLSDLHLHAVPGGDPWRLDPAQKAIFAGLGTAVARLDPPPDLVVVTGDLFDSAAIDPEAALAHFTAFRRLVPLAGIPMVLVPGNHDRRQMGTIGPHRWTLWDAFADVWGRDLQVAGARPDRRLVERLEAPAGLGMHLAAFDSTYLPKGLLGSGGWMRSEDLLSLGCRLPPDGQPLLLLQHNHLVPTPLTDVGRIDLTGRPAWLKPIIGRLLPALVANGDREELMMTALGSGTALSLLHRLGRRVVLLHGHKHYPAVRVLPGTMAGEGDLVLLAAGSAGVAEPWNTLEEEPLRLWPGFSLVRWDGQVLEAASHWFPPTPRHHGHGGTCRPLVRALPRYEAGWQVQPVDPPDVGPVRLALNESRVALEPAGARRWHALVDRCLVTAPGAPDRPYRELVQGAPGAQVEVHDPVDVRRPVPATVTLRCPGASRYTIFAGLCADRAAGERVQGEGNGAFERVGLVDRHAATEARLVLDPSRLPEDDARHLREQAFGSVLDLGTGLESPVPVADEGGKLVATLRPARARTLLRIHWPTR
jgi:3',5'-cyclic AMP phosphodiesterase CpdA